MTDLEYELNEAKSELARHHKDFQVIQDATDFALDELDRLKYWPHTEERQFEILLNAIKEIRSVVG